MTDPQPEPPKPTKPANLPTRLYMALTGRSNYHSSGRSSYAAKIGGYRFVKGGAIAINHPIDVLYFIKNKDKFPFIEMYSSKATLKGLHVVERFIELDPKKIKGEAKRKTFIKMLAECKEKYKELP